MRLVKAVTALLLAVCALAAAAPARADVAVIEVARVTALVMDALRKCAADWLKVNQKQVTLIVPANSALAYSAKIDVSAEILKKLNAVTIDFTKK